MEVVYTQDGIQEIARRFLAKTAGCKIFAFSGELGAGKTTFIRTLCEQLKVTEPATSPTYSIIQEYSTLNKEKIYHMDWYRLADEEEAIQAGVEECLLTGEICFIEWPEKAEKLLPDNAVYALFKIIDPVTREITVKIPA